MVPSSETRTVRFSCGISNTLISNRSSVPTRSPSDLGPGSWAGSGIKGRSTGWSETGSRIFRTGEVEGGTASPIHFSGSSPICSSTPR